MVGVVLDHMSLIRQALEILTNLEKVSFLCQTSYEMRQPAEAASFHRPVEDQAPYCTD